MIPMMPNTIATPPARPMPGGMPGMPGGMPGMPGAAPGGMDSGMLMQILGSLQSPERMPQAPATYPAPPMAMNPAFTQMALQALMGGSQGMPVPSLGSLIAGG